MSHYVTVFLVQTRMPDPITNRMKWVTLLDYQERAAAELALQSAKERFAITRLVERTVPKWLLR